MIIIGAIFMAAFICGLFAPVVDSKEREERFWEAFNSNPRNFDDHSKVEEA